MQKTTKKMNKMTRLEKIKEKLQEMQCDFNFNIDTSFTLDVEKMGKELLKIKRVKETFPLEGEYFEVKITYRLRREGGGGYSAISVYSNGTNCHIGIGWNVHETFPTLLKKIKNIVVETSEALNSYALEAKQWDVFLKDIASFEKYFLSALLQYEEEIQERIHFLIEELDE